MTDRPGEERLILVNEADEAVGYETKDRCHDGLGLLHRAFSVFLFDGGGALLIQQRSALKRLWPGFWSNSCCSHPREGETLEASVSRRVREELGMEVEPRYLYRFQYQAAFGERGSEHELCSVWIGRSAGAVRADPNEIMSCRFVAQAALTAEMHARPQDFTPWFRLEWERLTTEFGDELRSMQAPR